MCVVSGIQRQRKNVRTRNKLRYFNKCCWVRIKYYRTKEQNLLKTRFGVWVWFGFRLFQSLTSKTTKGFYMSACVFFLYLLLLTVASFGLVVVQCFYRPDRSVQPKIGFDFELVWLGIIVESVPVGSLGPVFNWEKFDSIKNRSNLVRSNFWRFK